ncbi:MAG: hypothetical protein EU541_04910 [Promethearchaeota archaeon]|nr:MAG: hypothetical protein EU541_04910 [Candidatus Lokiarchaeota archaeon]
MNVNNKKNGTEENDKIEGTEIIKQEPSARYQWCALVFVTTYFISWVFPVAFLFFYIIMFFLPYVLENPDFFSLFMELKPLITFMGFPLVLIISYFLHLFFAALSIKFWYAVSQRIVPSRDGVIPRNVSSKTLNLYHIRSFILKYPKNIVVKGLFPWLFTWVFNFIGSCDYGKGTTVEEQVLGDKFAETGENCYIGSNTSLASHLVEGIFGNIYYFKVVCGDNVTVSCESPLAPGTHLEDDTYILPLGAALKFTRNKGENYYFGMPIRRIFTRKVQKYLDLSDEDLERAENLMEKRKKEKNNK